MNTESMLTIIWLGFFACIFFGWYFYLKARNKERMALIERNACIPEIFKPHEFRFRFPWFKIGMLITGIGFGLVVASIFDIFMRVRGEFALSLMMLFGGILMIIAYFVDKPKDR